MKSSIKDKVEGTPWEGRQTKPTLKEIAVEMREKTNQLSDNWQERAPHFSEKGKNVKEQRMEVGINRGVILD
jgi:hypothetical protein